MVETYRQSTRKQFEYYQSLGDKTMAQLTEADLFWQPNEASNSIAVTVQHLWGNMLSRWTDFLTTDGEKSWRDRDGEFEASIKSKEELEVKWQAGWECLFQALDSINADNFDTPVYIRQQKHHIIEAVNRQLAHYAYHVGQIVYVGRMCANEDWQSLSIPKGGSVAYNAKKQAKGKHGGHFTDEFR